MIELDDGAMRLRSGVSVWDASNNGPEPRARAPLQGERFICDVVIVGGGVTGAFAAERLTREGWSVIVIDRHRPTTASTMASTAMIQWELDASLVELEDRLGEEAMQRICAQSRQGVTSIAGLVNANGIACEFTPQRSVYLAGDKHDAADLRAEMRLREMAGVACNWLDGAALAKLGLEGEAGLTSPGSASLNPVALARGLLRAAVARGALILSPAVAEGFEEDADATVVALDRGASVRAKWLVLANGYEMPDFVPAHAHSIVSSWALASAPLNQAQREAVTGRLVWEAADPYLYMRLGPDGCLIVGGEDAKIADAARRDALTGQKTRDILAKVAARCPVLSDVEARFAWAGFFGETEDSLPLIGRVPGRERCLAAFGYGGNGITFSAIAADMIALAISGAPHANADLYAIDRSGDRSGDRAG